MQEAIEQYFEHCCTVQHEVETIEGATLYSFLCTCDATLYSLLCTCAILCIVSLGVQAR